KKSRRWDNLCGGHRTQLLKPTEEPIPLLAHSRHSDDTGVCPREQIGHEADGVECSFMTPKRTLMAFSGAKSAVHSSFKSEHLRAIVTPHRGDSHGEAGGPANRLGERKLELRRRVGASRFCLHLCWNGPFARAHDSRMCIDGPSVRHGIPVLDLLS